MGNGAPGSGDGLIALFGLAYGAMHAARLYRYLRTRIVQPGAADPARLLKGLLFYGIPLLAVAVLVANVVAFHVWSLDALIPAILLDVVAVIGLLCVSAMLWVAAEQRRVRAGYVISEHSYRDAPRQVTSTMRRIHKSTRSVSGGRANSEGMFGDLSTDQLLYEAAQQAVVSSELSAAVRDLKASQTSEDRDALTAASDQLDEILEYLLQVEASLTRAAGTASRLSESIARPERERAARKLAEEAAAATARRRQQARARLDEAGTRAAARPVSNASDIEERVSAVDKGYEEVSRASDAVLEGRPIPADEPEVTSAPEDERRREAREAVWKATRVSAGKAGKLSIAAARFGSEKLRNLNKEQNKDQ